jgi:hypothetical protein
MGLLVQMGRSDMSSPGARLSGLGGGATTPSSQQDGVGQVRQGGDLRWRSVGMSKRAAMPAGYANGGAWSLALVGGDTATRPVLTAGLGTLSASGARGVNGAAVLTGVGTLAGDLQMLAYLSAALTGVAVLSAAATATANASSSIDGTGTLTAEVVGALVLVAELAGDGSLSATISGALSAEAALVGSGSLDALLVAIGELQAALEGAGNVTATMKAALGLSASITAGGDVGAVLVGIGEAVAAIHGLGATTGTMRADGFMVGEITPFTELSPQALAAAVWNALAVDLDAAGTFGGLVQAPVYTAKVALFDDDASGADRYVVSWFRDGAVLVAGITAPSIRVVRVADGTDLIAPSAMVEIGALHRFRFDAAGADRIVSGAAYLAILTATIDGAVRSWDQPIGRDSG